MTSMNFMKKEGPRHAPSTTRVAEILGQTSAYTHLATNFVDADTKKIIDVDVKTFKVH